MFSSKRILLRPFSHSFFRLVIEFKDFLRPELILLPPWPPLLAAIFFSRFKLENVGPTFSSFDGSTAHARTHDTVPLKDWHHFYGEQEWRSGESFRLPPVWPVFDFPTRRHMWVEFVVWFYPPLKNQHVG